MPKCNCKKDKCLSPAVLQINNYDCPTVFHKVTFPAAMGDDETNPPRNGQYRNVLLVYEANGHVYMFSSDGVPTFISDGGRGVDDYNELTNKPSIDGHELVGESSLEDIGVMDAIEEALEDYTPTSDLAEVAFSGDYDDLENAPTPPVTHFYLVPAYTEGSPSLVYNDSAHTSQTTYQEFQNAILSGPVQIHQEYDTDTYWISNIALTDIWLNEYISFYTDAEQWRGLYRWDSTEAAPFFQGSQNYYNQIQADWNVTSPTLSSYIKNKPNLATVATSGSYNDLINKPTIPAAQVNSDWNANSGVAEILNKPTIPTVNDATLTIQRNGTNVATFTANASSNVTADISVPTLYTTTGQNTDGAVTQKLFTDTVGNIETILQTLNNGGGAQ